MSDLESFVMCIVSTVIGGFITLVVAIIVLSPIPSGMLERSGYLVIRHSVCVGGVTSNWVEVVRADGRKVCNEATEGK